MSFQQTRPQRGGVTAARKRQGECPQVMLAELLSKYVAEGSDSRQACGGPFFSSWDLENNTKAGYGYNAKSWKYPASPVKDLDNDAISTAVPSRQTTTDSTWSMESTQPGHILLPFPPGLEAPSLFDMLPPPGFLSPAAPVMSQFPATPGPAPPGLLLPAPAALEAPDPEDVPKPGSWLQWQMNETFSSLMHSEHCRPKSRCTGYDQSDGKTITGPQIPQRRPDVQHTQAQPGARGQPSSAMGQTLKAPARIKFCTQCGEEAQSGHSFCMFCGERMPSFPSVTIGL